MNCIRIYNRQTNEVLEKRFEDESEIEAIENVLDFLDNVEYEVVFNGELLAY